VRYRLSRCSLEIFARDYLQLQTLPALGIVGHHLEFGRVAEQCRRS